MEKLPQQLCGEHFPEFHNTATNSFSEVTGNMRGATKQLSFDESYMQNSFLRPSMSMLETPELINNPYIIFYESKQLLSSIYRRKHESFSV